MTHEHILKTVQAFAQKNQSTYVKDALLSTACGHALANPTKNTLCIITEHTGTTWTAIEHASKEHYNIIAIVVHYTGSNLTQKYKAFNWNVIEIDGKDTKHLTRALKEAKDEHKPTAIIAHL